jgi:hypothetical protein
MTIFPEFGNKEVYKVSSRPLTFRMPLYTIHRMPPPLNSRNIFHTCIIYTCRKYTIKAPQVRIAVKVARRDTEFVIVVAGFIMLEIVQICCGK